VATVERDARLRKGRQPVSFTTDWALTTRQRPVYGEFLFEVGQKAARAAIKPSGAVLPGFVRGIGTAPDRLRAADEGRKDCFRDAYHADEQEPVRIEVPRVRDDSFEPQIIPKHARRFTGFDDKVIAMYARGMTVREVQGFFA